MNRTSNRPSNRQFEVTEAQLPRDHLTAPMSSLSVENCVYNVFCLCFIATMYIETLF